MFVLDYDESSAGLSRYQHREEAFGFCECMDDRIASSGTCVASHQVSAVECGLRVAHALQALPFWHLRYGITADPVAMPLLLFEHSVLSLL